MLNVKLSSQSRTSTTELTKNIFNLQEQQQNTWNCKSLFQQIFIGYKTFTVGIKLKTCQERPDFVVVL